MGYTKFCQGGGDHVTANSLTKRIDHKACVSCGADWSGPTIGRGLVDPTTGEVAKAHLFVGVLPFSQKACFEATLDMKEPTWLKCHVRKYECWGGVPEQTVCDNMETDVVKHPREGKIVLNDAYEAPGEHHMTAMMPGRVRKPKQKASAGGAVRDAATWVIAQLRDDTFTGIDEVTLAVRRCLDEYNAHPFQKREGSRDEIFEEAEAAQPPARRRRHARGGRGRRAGCTAASSTSTSTSPTPRAATPCPTAAWGTRWICVLASPPSESATPARE